jgi:hypothetical protein
MVQVFEHADLLGKCGQGAGLRRHSREANLGFVLEKEKNKMQFSILWEALAAKFGHDLATLTKLHAASNDIDRPWVYLS